MCSCGVSSMTEKKYFHKKYQLDLLLFVSVDEDEDIVTY